MFVVTMDQRGSRQRGDLVPALLDLVGSVPAELGFERSVGDEVQAVFKDANAVVDACLRALRDRNWYVGIGVGDVDLPLPASPREASGPAFVAARRAVERAKKSGERVPLAAEGSPAAADAEAVLGLLGALVSHRTPAEWRVLDRLSPGVRGRQAVVAAELGITPQAVSKAVLRSGWQEEWAARPAAAVLLERADRQAGRGGEN
ncbi:MarR family transcriptional regulator [Paenarthrobacter sp. DKR-5]|uniref:MarR family transcriptional regulator n=1 Tax=Paenarthrobacter sp. DKR-5 TaxID=2835535 RepID=UPI001BDD9E66|nr:MarR family transcriptional regulator [Paenarthrobacter sp. DKR-5]MBT1002678.1 MarR family transcriptional regulator [Paenarthrobacter sp. DKR-5]